MSPRLSAQPYALQERLEGGVWVKYLTPYRPDLNEHAGQAALMSWAAMSAARFPEFTRLLYAVPNGGQRTKAAAGKLAAEGVKAGVSDLCLAVRRVNPAGLTRPGLYLEMKAKGNQPTPDQRAFLEAAALQGYAVGVCWAWESARDLLEAYMAGQV